MRTKFSAVTLALAIAATLIGATPVSAQQRDSSTIQLHVPDSIGSYAMIERTDFDDRADGVSLRYQRADSLRIDVFIYPGADLATNCPRDCAQKVLENEIAGFIGSFPQLVQRKYYDSISVRDDRVLTPTAGDQWQMGRHLRLHAVIRGAPRQSDFYLYYLPGFRVKLRATYAADSTLATAVADFSRRVIPALTAPALVASGGSDDETHMTVSVTLPGNRTTVFDKLVTALSKSGYTIADSNRADGRITTAPNFAWPAGSEKEKWHGKDSPGVVIMTRLTIKGDSTLVEIGGRSPAVAGWKDAEVASQLELISVVMLAGDLPTPKPR